MGHNAISGLITEIQRFSTDDGPGIRTTVFLKGCGLGCLWCHNPETLSQELQLQYNHNDCRNCGCCAGACGNSVHVIEPGGHRLMWKRCNGCFLCVTQCHYGALSIVGRRVSVEELCAELLRDKVFYDHSGGGVTLSGGEPLLQGRFCTNVLETLRLDGIHTVIDTAGHVPLKSFEAALPFTNLVLFDLKLMDSGKHKAMTGQVNDKIVQNYEELCRRDTPIWVRIPLIIGVNDSLQDIERFIPLLVNRRNVKKVQLRAYHGLGSGKYAALGMEERINTYKTPSKQAMQDVSDMFKAAGIENVEQ